MKQINEESPEDIKVFNGKTEEEYIETFEEPKQKRRNNSVDKSEEMKEPESPQKYFF